MWEVVKVRIFVTFQVLWAEYTPSELDMRRLILPFKNMSQNSNSVGSSSVFSRECISGSNPGEAGLLPVDVNASEFTEKPGSPEWPSDGPG